MILRTSAGVLAAVIAVGFAVIAIGLPAIAPAQEAAAPMVEAEIIALPEWRTETLYEGGWSAEEFIDEMEVYEPTGEEIGDVENLVIDLDGRVLSVIAEIGGFLDIGDTHVNVPWERIEFTAARDGIIIPVTQETIEEFSLFPDEVISAPQAAAEIEVVEEDPITTPRTWLASELIGDYVRLRGADVATAPGVASEVEPGLDPVDAPAETAVAPAAGLVNYGYVDDLIIRDGRVAAVVVSPDVTWGAPGLFAYPYYGYGYGWYPGAAIYDLPYTREDIAGTRPLEAERFEAD